ncbi:MAG: molybdate ABC transporter permease subunit [Gammaproteobacteria bacterium]|nr:molybdate ABC transporter permease subunit [Gammaproteobacteria bacterium]
MSSLFTSLSPVEIRALWLSLKVAFWCTLLGALPAIGLAWVLARRNFWGKSLLEAFVYLPMILPPVVLGYLLLVMFGRNGWIGQWLQPLGIQLAFHWTGAVLASWLMSLPLFVQPIRLALQNVDVRLEQAAQTLGASPWRAFLTITIPLCMPAILMGAVLAFGRSLGEFGATITFVGNIDGETRTLPLAIYAAIQSPDGETLALRLVILSIIVALFTLGASQWLARRSHQRLGYRDV